MPTEATAFTVVAASNEHGTWDKTRIRTDEEKVIDTQPACLPASVEQFISPPDDDASNLETSPHYHNELVDTKVLERRRKKTTNH